VGADAGGAEGVGGVWGAVEGDEGHDLED
jgi:hypothetical protein